MYQRLPQRLLLPRDQVNASLWCLGWVADGKKVSEGLFEPLLLPVDRCVCMWTKPNLQRRIMQRRESYKWVSRIWDRQGTQVKALIFFLSIHAPLHTWTQLHEVPWTVLPWIKRIWVGVRDEHSSCHITCCVGAELVRKDCHRAAGTNLCDAQCCGQANDTCTHHCNLGWGHLQDAEPEERGSYLHLETTYHTLLSSRASIRLWNTHTKCNIIPGLWLGLKKPQPFIWQN